MPTEKNFPDQPGTPRPAPAPGDPRAASDDKLRANEVPPPSKPHYGGMPLREGETDPERELAERQQAEAARPAHTHLDPQATPYPAPTAETPQQRAQREQREAAAKKSDDDDDDDNGRKTVVRKK